MNDTEAIIRMQAVQDELRRREDDIDTPAEGDELLAEWAELKATLDRMPWLTRVIRDGERTGMYRAYCALLDDLEARGDLSGPGQDETSVRVLHRLGYHSFARMWDTTSR